MIKMDLFNFVAIYLGIAALFATYLVKTGEYPNLKTPILAGLTWIVIIPVIMLVCLISGIFIAIAFINIKRSKPVEKIE